MQEDALQVAFEIKTACDQISRELLRWHWEQKPGSHSLDSLLRHLAQRQKESPDYYDRMPDLSGKTSWQQLDTTLCMRVLLDPEKDAARPLDRLGSTARPGAARRACNAVRAARNEAAHAADARDAAQAALLFQEAVESLEEGYLGTAFKEGELAQYYRQAEGFLAECGAGSQPKASGRGSAQGAKPRSTSRKKPASGTAASRSNGHSSKKSANRKQPPRRGNGSRKILAVLLVVLVLGLVVRGLTMGQG